jgi:glyoxylase I family protein
MNKPYQFKAIHHVTILVANLQTSLEFYVDFLGIALDPNRPDKGFPGVWLTLGGQQIHLIEDPSAPYQTDPEVYGGRTRHFAMVLSGLNDLKALIEARGIPYKESRSGRPVIFIRDPDGNVLELIEA